MASMSDSGSRHHAIDYIELTVTDAAEAKAFYAAAFGWEFNDYGPAYAGIVNPGGPDLPEVGGLATSDTAAVRGGPLVLLYSDDLDATAEHCVPRAVRSSTGPTRFPAAAGSISRTRAATNSGCGRPRSRPPAGPARRPGTVSKSEGSEPGRGASK